MRSLHTNIADKVDRMKPDTRNSLNDKHRPEWDLEALVMERAEAELVRECIRGLPKHRRVMDLKVAGLERGETAAEMGLRDETGKTPVSRAYRRVCSEPGSGTRAEDDTGGA